MASKVFKTLDEQVEEDKAEDVGPTEIESMCVECQENVSIKMLP